MTDLQIQLLAWQQEGDALIVGGDWNDDTSKSDWKAFWTSLGLTAADAFNEKPQATYFRGVRQLDNIYVSPIFTQAQGGFIPSTDATLGADHMALWLDIPLEILKMGQLAHRSHTARRLKTQSPVTREAYLSQYTNFCDKHNLFAQSCSLWQQAKEGTTLTREQQQEYESIDALCVQGMNLAEKKCRKLRMGTIEWSPDLAQSRARIAAWNALIRARLHVKISSRLICRLLKKAGLGPVCHITLEQAKINLKAEYKTYSGLKSKSSTLRTSFLEHLASEQAIDQDLNVDNHLKQL